MTNPFLISLILLAPTFVSCGTKTTKDKENLEKTKEELQRVSDEKASLEESLKTTDEKVLALEETQKNLKLQLDQTNSEKEELAVRANLLQSTIDGIATEIDEKTKETEAVKKLLESLSGDLTQNEAARAKLTEKFGKLESDIKASKTKLELAEKEKVLFKKDAELKKTKIDELTLKINSLKTSLEGVSPSQSLATERTLDPMVGIYRSSDPLPNTDCYKLVDIKSDGTVTMAVACANGRLETVRTKVESFEVQDAERRLAKYGMAVKVGSFDSACGQEHSFKNVSQVLMEATRFDNAVIPFEYISINQGGEASYYETIAFGFILPNPPLDMARRVAEGYNNLPPYAAVVTYLEKASDRKKQGCFDASLGFKPLSL